MLQLTLRRWRPMLALTTIGLLLAMSSSKVPARDDYHHGDLRRHLIAIAREIVASKGPAGVSLREAARIAGVSHNAPYRHFESREHLLSAVAAEGFRELEGELKSAASKVTQDQRLNAIGRAYLRFALNNRGLYLLMFGSELDKTGNDELAEASRAAFAQLDASIAARGGSEPSAGATAAWAFVHGLAHLIIDEQIDLKEKDIPSIFAAAADVLGRRVVAPSTK
jgi:AcrR family transcriptional regulator